MGIFSRLFGKKKEEDELGLGQPLPGMEPTPEYTGLQEKSPVPEPPSHELPPNLEEPMAITSSRAAASQRDLELINSKLDTLKAILNSMDQRIANLEKAAGVEQKKVQW